MIMKSFRQFLLEKLILFNNGARFGQIVVTGGGAGSGKSFVVKNYLESDKFKIIDVDAWKESFIKLKKYPEWKDFDFKDSSSVSKLHLWVIRSGIRDKVLDLLFDPTRNKELLPNILFDISLGNVNQLTEIIGRATKAGYSPENIHLVYVLSDWEDALNRNRDRERILPDGVVLKTLNAAGKVVVDLVTSELPTDFNGTIKVVDTSSKGLEYFTIKKEGKPIDSKSGVIEKFKELIDKRLGAQPEPIKKGVAE